MKTVDFLKQEDFPGLLMLIKKFAETTDTPFHTHVHEVSSSFLYGSNVITIVGKDDEKPFPLVAYICGYFSNPEEFLMTQAYSEDPKLTPIIGNFFEDHLRSLKIKKVFTLFKHSPKLPEKYGYKVERYLMVKEL